MHEPIDVYNLFQEMKLFLYWCNFLYETSLLFERSLFKLLLCVNAYKPNFLWRFCFSAFDEFIVILIRMTFLMIIIYSSSFFPFWPCVVKTLGSASNLSGWMWREQYHSIGHITVWLLGSFFRSYLRFIGLYVHFSSSLYISVCLVVK